MDRKKRHKNTGYKSKETSKVKFKKIESPKELKTKANNNEERIAPYVKKKNKLSSIDQTIEEVINNSTQTHTKTPKTKAELKQMLPSQPGPSTMEVNTVAVRKKSQLSRSVPHKAELEQMLLVQPGPSNMNARKKSPSKPVPQKGAANLYPKVLITNRINVNKKRKFSFSSTDEELDYEFESQASDDSEDQQSSQMSKTGQFTTSTSSSVLKNYNNNVLNQDLPDIIESKKLKPKLENEKFFRPCTVNVVKLTEEELDLHLNKRQKLITPFINVERHFKTVANAQDNESCKRKITKRQNKFDRNFSQSESSSDKSDSDSSTSSDSEHSKKAVKSYRKRKHDSYKLRNTKTKHKSEYNSKKSVIEAFGETCEYDDYKNWNETGNEDKHSENYLKSEEMSNEIENSDDSISNENKHCENYLRYNKMSNEVESSDESSNSEDKNSEIYSRSNKTSNEIKSSDGITNDEDKHSENYLRSNKISKLVEYSDESSSNEDKHSENYSRSKKMSNEVGSSDESSNDEDTNFKNSDESSNIEDKHSENYLKSMKKGSEVDSSHESSKSEGKRSENYIKSNKMSNEVEYSDESSSNEEKHSENYLNSNEINDEVESLDESSSNEDKYSQNYLNSNEIRNETENSCKISSSENDGNEKEMVHEADNLKNNIRYVGIKEINCSNFSGKILSKYRAEKNLSHDFNYENSSVQLHNQKLTNVYRDENLNLKVSKPILDESKIINLGKKDLEKNYANTNVFENEGCDRKEEYDFEDKNYNLEKNISDIEEKLRSKIKKTVLNKDLKSDEIKNHSKSHQVIPLNNSDIGFKKPISFTTKAISNKLTCSTNSSYENNILTDNASSTIDKPDDDDDCDVISLFPESCISTIDAPDLVDIPTLFPNPKTVRDIPPKRSDRFSNLTQKKKPIIFNVDKSPEHIMEQDADELPKTKTVSVNKNLSDEVFDIGVHLAYKSNQEPVDKPVNKFLTMTDGRSPSIISSRSSITPELSSHSHSIVSASLDQEKKGSLHLGINSDSEERKSILKVDYNIQVEELGSLKSESCFRCGEFHSQARCKHFSSICRICKHKGHIAVMCKNKPGTDLIFQRYCHIYLKSGKCHRPPKSCSKVHEIPCEDDISSNRQPSRPEIQYLHNFLFSISTPPVQFVRLLARYLSLHQEVAELLHLARCLKNKCEFHLKEYWYDIVTALASCMGNNKMEAICRLLHHLVVQDETEFKVIDKMVEMIVLQFSKVGNLWTAVNCLLLVPNYILPVNLVEEFLDQIILENKNTFFTSKMCLQFIKLNRIDLQALVKTNPQLIQRFQQYLLLHRYVNYAYKLKVLRSSYDNRHYNNAVGHSNSWEYSNFNNVYKSQCLQFEKPVNFKSLDINEHTNKKLEISKNVPSTSTSTFSCHENAKNKPPSTSNDPQAVSSNQKSPTKTVHLNKTNCFDLRQKIERKKKYLAELNQDTKPSSSSSKSSVNNSFDNQQVVNTFFTEKYLEPTKFPISTTKPPLFKKTDTSRDKQRSTNRNSQEVQDPFLTYNSCNPQQRIQNTSKVSKPVINQMKFQQQNQQPDEAISTKFEEDFHLLETILLQESINWEKIVAIFEYWKGDDIHTEKMRESFFANISSNKDKMIKKFNYFTTHVYASNSNINETLCYIAFKVMEHAAHQSRWHDAYSAFSFIENEKDISFAVFNDADSEFSQGKQILFCVEICFRTFHNLKAIDLLKEYHMLYPHSNQWKIQSRESDIEDRNQLVQLLMDTVIQKRYENRQAFEFFEDIVEAQKSCSHPINVIRHYNELQYTAFEQSAVNGLTFFENIQKKCNVLPNLGSSNHRSVVVAKVMEYGYDAVKMFYHRGIVLSVYPRQVKKSIIFIKSIWTVEEIGLILHVTLEELSKEWYEPVPSYPVLSIIIENELQTENVPNFIKTDNSILGAKKRLSVALSKIQPQILTNINSVQPADSKIMFEPRSLAAHLNFLMLNNSERE